MKGAKRSNPEQKCGASFLVWVCWLYVGCGAVGSPPDAVPASANHASADAIELPTPIGREDEPRLANVRKLTSGGENAEAYWNVEGTELVFQSTRGDLACDQIFRMNADGSALRQVSVGGGRTTCGYIN